MWKSSGYSTSSPTLDLIGLFNLTYFSGCARVSCWRLLWSYVLTSNSSFHIFADFSFFFLRFYLFIREREAEIQAEGEVGTMQWAQCGTRSRDPRIMTWAEGRRSAAEPPRHPSWPFLHLLLKRMYSNCPFFTGCLLSYKSSLMYFEYKSYS